MQNVHPYIGATGFTTLEPLEKARHIIASLVPSHLFMGGLLQTHNSIHNVPLKHPWDKRTPTLRDLRGLCTLAPRGLTMVHYAPGNATEGEVLADLKMIARVAGQGFDGFQMNGPLPEPALLKFCRDRRDLFALAPRFVLQINQKTLARFGGDFAELMSQLEEYEGLAHYVLFDMSGGLAKVLDVAQALAFLRAHRESGLTLRPVIAGGIGPETFQMLAPIFAEFPEVSTDMEGAVMGEDGTISSALVETALRGIASLISK